ncbi:MAG: hypothetical protein IJH65_03920 [Methanobrevibacter sp.]|nr:hypothetical protein [Methanobrevibacter sp.]
MNLVDRNKIRYIDISDGQVPDGVWISFRDRINEMPTVDAVPVVRCKDCKYLNIINKAPLYAYCGKSNYIFHLWEEDTREHFCSWGERR